MDAVFNAIHILQLSSLPNDIDSMLKLVLGEGQFGPTHWHLSPLQRLFYVVRPLMPQGLKLALRRKTRPQVEKCHKLGWPIEPRYVRFLWEVLRQIQILTNTQEVAFESIWPEGFDFAFVLTHDIETKDGQAFVREVADFEESLGFRSSFSFVPEKYDLDLNLMQELRRRGFEITVHGLKHDGNLFNSRDEFLRRVEKINLYIREFEAKGFRSPCTLRNPEWMQALDIEYDLSFFDTDPFEPIPGGTMCIWPFYLGRFIELPYTLVQDHTLIRILQETTPRIWLEKVEFIEKYHGMALLISHPDYLQDPIGWRVYTQFLQAMKTRDDCWHALPRDVAHWWRKRSVAVNNTG